MDNFIVNFHASIRIQGKSAVIYIDPLNIEGNPQDADIVLITHLHYDHLSIKDIKKVANEKTWLMGPADAMDKLVNSGFKLNDNFSVITEKSFSTDGKPQWFYFDKLNANVDCFRAYNINKWRTPSVPYHPKENNWAGYIIELDGLRYAICGDTDFTPELANIQDINVLFLPIGGKYTMGAKEAAECANIIKPKLVVPIHYNAGYVGTKEDEQAFLNHLDKKIAYRIFL